MRTFLKEHEVQYYETDQMSVVHHSNYFRWMEEARTSLLNELGWGYAELEHIGVISPVIDIQCKYLKSVLFGDTVRIETEVTEYNGLKIYFQYRIIRCSNDELCAKGNSVHCFLDRNGRPLILRKSNPEFDQCIRTIVADNIDK